MTLLRRSRTLSAELRSEVRVCQRVAFNEPQERVTEQERIAAVVEAKRELIEVRLHVLVGELVIAPDHSAVEQAPRTLNGVRVDRAAHPLIAGVIDVGVVRNAAVGAKGIR